MWRNPRGPVILDTHTHKYSREFASSSPRFSLPSAAVFLLHSPPPLPFYSHTCSFTHTHMRTRIYAFMCIYIISYIYIILCYIQSSRLHMKSHGQFCNTGLTSTTVFTQSVERISNKKRTEAHKHTFYPCALIVHVYVHCVRTHK
jgi:hypothetical protein